MDKPVIAVIGGAVAGSEAAALICEAGGEAVVFERGPRPYGKIEEGLPRWHDKLRRQEYRKIDSNLDRSSIRFLPETPICPELTLDDLIDLGFSAVVLANGAQKDRRLAVEGIEEFEGQSFWYQNAFVRAFNAHALGDLAEGALVVGGGLASIDVAKILSLSTNVQALRALGHDVDVEALEKRGIPTWCESNDVPLPDVQPPRILYRRTKQQMAVVTVPADPTEKQRAKAEKARAKIIERVERRYRIKLEELVSPVEALVSGGTLVGLRCVRNSLATGRLTPTEESVDFEAKLVVSSIGSTPEPLPGVEMDGELYCYADQERGLLCKSRNIFALGNVLTGRGNIRDSRINAREIANAMIGQADTTLIQSIHDAAHAGAVPTVALALERPAPNAEQKARIDAFVNARWSALSYRSYQSWIESHPGR